MGIVPKLKKAELSGDCIILNKIKWVFGDEVDERVIKEAKRMGCCDESGIPVYINHKNETGESYIIDITKSEVRITAESGAGAFYALQTLKMKRSKLPTGRIEDYPDMAYWGFYQDVTRGRIPTLDSLKRLADTLAGYKMNSLQLYVEHVFEFEEYEFCRDTLGYISKEEMKELDEYCHERFIDLVPSLSTFGHLYHLLQHDENKHLCELTDYEPTEHYWKERMRHHTINPSLDETFDLGNGANKGKDSGRLYVDFVKKIIQYVNSKGKIAMMWGDIILEHLRGVVCMKEPILKKKI